jgi:hypothetical protein
MSTKYVASGKKKTVKRIKSNGKTKRNMNNKAFFITTFLELLNMIKLFHWKTQSYSLHIATDNLHSKLSENIDRFVEILIAKNNHRINGIHSQLNLVHNNNTQDFIQKIHKFREFFISIEKYLDGSKDSDLLSIRDDILADINQFLYLSIMH